MIGLTPFFRRYAERRRRWLDGVDSVRMQERQLLRLVERAKHTRFGRDHGFASIRTIRDYQKAVPLRRYEAMWSEYWQHDYPNLTDVSWPGKIPFFAVTSGTTSGTSKNIPVTHEMNRANARGALDLLLHHLTRRPESRAIDGRNFFLGGSVALRECAPNVFCGDLSGIALRQSPRWYRPFMFPPPEIAAESDWETRIETLLPLIPQTNIRILGGTPSWLLYLIERQRARGGVDATDLYPNLELLVHGGVSFKPYRARFEAFLAGRAEMREVYPASEGFIASQDARAEDGLRLMIDNGLFFEFVPVEELDAPSPTRHTVADALPDVDYAIVLSTCAGSWSYVLGDTVRFISRDPPRIVITGRTSYFMSAFGEHLIGEEIEDAVAAGAMAIRAAMSEFSLGAIFPDANGESGYHLYIVEFEKYPLSPDDAQNFLTELETALFSRNDDYRVERQAYGVIGAPRLLAVPPGTFASWMKSRGRFGGQNKVPRVINDHKIFAELNAFARNAITTARNASTDPS